MFALRLCLLVLRIVWFGLLGVVCVVTLLVACFGYCDFEIVVEVYLPWWFGFGWQFGVCVKFLFVLLFVCLLTLTLFNSVEHLLVLFLIVICVCCLLCS